MSLQDILRRRQHAQADFVGRDSQIDRFRQNLNLSPQDDRRRFIFNVYGQSGVGKTRLLEQYRKLTDKVGAISAWVDESVVDVPGAMGQVVEQFEQRGP